jgi:hypothetical protein
VTSDACRSRVGPEYILQTSRRRTRTGDSVKAVADGQRFLMIKDSATDDPNATPASMVVVLNWFEELKQRVPTSGK